MNVNVGVIGRSRILICSHDAEALRVMSNVFSSLAAYDTEIESVDLDPRVCVIADEISQRSERTSVPPWAGGGDVEQRWRSECVSISIFLGHQVTPRVVIICSLATSQLRRRSDVPFFVGIEITTVASRALEPTLVLG